MAHRRFLSLTKRLPPSHEQFQSFCPSSPFFIRSFHQLRTHSELLQPRSLQAPSGLSFSGSAPPDHLKSSPRFWCRILTSSLSASSLWCPCTRRVHERAPSLLSPLYIWAGKNMLLKRPGSRLNVSLESGFGALALLLSCHVSLHGLVRLYKPQFSWSVQWNHTSPPSKMLF